MKLVPLIIISIFAPLIALAQEAATGDLSKFSPAEKTAVPGPQAGNYQIAYAYTTSNSLVEQDALNASLNFSADPRLYTEITQTVRPGTDVVSNWRERIFTSLSAYLGPRPRDRVNDNHLVSNNELDEQANEKRMVTKIVLKETLKYARERIPEIDEAVKTLRFEVTNRPPAESSGAAANEKKPGGNPPPSKNNLSEARLYLKTGLRVPVDGGRISLVSESEARYGKMSSFLKINLDGRYDSNTGLTYVLGRDFLLRVERQDVHTTDPLTGDTVQGRLSLNLVQVIYAF